MTRDIFLRSLNEIKRLSGEQLNKSCPARTFHPHNSNFAIARCPKGTFRAIYSPGDTMRSYGALQALPNLFYPQCVPTERSDPSYKADRFIADNRFFQRMSRRDISWVAVDNWFFQRSIGTFRATIADKTQ